MSVADKTIVITGASRGLGAGLASVWASQGARLALCARTEPSSPDSAVGALTASVDVRDPARVAWFAERVALSLGPIDLWINNAGVLEPIAPLRKVEADELERHLAINVVGVHNGSRSFVGALRQVDRGGVLVNISSGAARSAYEGWSAYCAGKAAVDRMTEVLALEERDTGLRAYAVAPGVIDTDMQEMIRGTSAEDFPLVERFRELERSGGFTTVDEVAEGLARLAFGEPHHPEVIVDLRDL